MSCSLGQTHQAVKAIHETATLSDFVDGHDDTWHERLARGRVVPDRQDLPEAPEDDLLVRDQAGQPNAVDVDTTVDATPGPIEQHRGGLSLTEVLAAGLAHGPGRRH